MILLNTPTESLTRLVDICRANADYFFVIIMRFQSLPQCNPAPKFWYTLFFYFLILLHI